MFYKINGDLFINQRAISAYNFMSGRISPVASPIFETLSGGLISLKRPKAITFFGLIHIFDSKVYLWHLICIFGVSALLYFSNQPCKLSKFPLYRQLFEIFMLMAFEPKLPGLTKERNHIIRVIMTVAILSGLLMQKTFRGQFNAIFAFESFDFVTDLNASLKNHPEIKDIITKDYIGMVFLKTHPEISEKYNITAYGDEELEIEDLLNKPAVYFYQFAEMQQIQLNYPFLPASLSKLKGFFGQLPVYYLPIHKKSSLFGEIYSAMHKAFDNGITDRAFKEMQRIQSHSAKSTNKYDAIKEVFRESKFFQENRKRNHKVDLITLKSRL